MLPYRRPLQWLVLCSNNSCSVNCGYRCKSSHSFRTVKVGQTSREASIVALCMVKPVSLAELSFQVKITRHTKSKRG